MASDSRRHDLIVLVPDSNTEYTMKGLLARSEAIGTRKIDATVLRHPERDPGCFLRAPDFLKPFRGEYLHALVLSDLHGSGRESLGRIELEGDLERRLAADWTERAAAVVIDPELEVWLWSDSPEVDRVLGWQDRKPNLRSWLVASGFASNRRDKPERPKEAVERALRVVRKARSSALYLRLAQTVSLRRCRDVGFLKMTHVLRGWFPMSTAT